MHKIIPLEIAAGLIYVRILPMIELEKYRVPFKIRRYAFYQSDLEVRLDSPRYLVIGVL